MEPCGSPDLIGTVDDSDPLTNQGSNMEPCGSPDLTGTIDDSDPLTTATELPFSSSAMLCSILAETPL